MAFRAFLASLTAAALAMSVPGVALAARPVGGARYAGSSSQGQPVVMRVAPSRTRLSGLRLLLSVSCGDGSVEPSRVVLAHSGVSAVRIAPSGRLRGSISLAGEGVSHDVLAVSGRFASSRRATGALRESYLRDDGVRCASGRVTFALRRGARAPRERPIGSRPPTVAGWPRGTYAGTLTVDFQIKQDYQPGGWYRATYPATVSIADPLGAQAGTPERNPFNLTLATGSSLRPGDLNMVSATPWRSLSTGAWMVSQWWLIQGSGGVFSGSLNPAEIYDIAGSGGGQFVSVEVSNVFPSGIPCIASFNLGTTTNGAFTGSNLTLSVAGTATGECMVPLGFRAQFSGTHS